ncbi:hypothetical protein CUJ83_01605 [Methanocella sp. CWC-04]|uniref:PEGA domain-containing protein n=1 Tax=Methanooceanicella nereidis TaxID=2052831 RepID=A0AAP2RBQ6_9EURY|nr:carboxypeptidase regulatory-like domain-containing protein [Methanocella sp. CWC-04]MCD1293690.1 hypothetical protein [Methanocella sp. CWC-04]
MKKILSLLLISIMLLPVLAITNATAGSNTVTVMGQVTDRHGNPVQGAVATLIDAIYLEVDQTITDQNGNFEFVNANLKTDTCKVKVSYKEGSTVYETKLSLTKWYMATSGIIQVDRADTKLELYPPPEYGYVWGFIQNENGNTIDGVVYAVSTTGEQTFYSFAQKTNGGNGQFTFYLPKGTYNLYAQHENGGVIYQSTKRVQVTVEGNLYLTDVPAPTMVTVPLTAPASSPDPASIPQTYHNKINGTVKTKDGKPYADAVISVYQQSDDMSRYIKRDIFTAKTNADGYFEIYGIDVRSDDDKEVFGRKNFMISVEYTDTNGAKANVSEYTPLYHPNVIMPWNMEQAARNVTLDIKLPFTTMGWVNINSDPPGAALYVDGQPLLDGNGKQYVTPCVAYIPAGNHEVKLAYEGYSDKAFMIEMEENKEHQSVFASLERSLVPSWTPVVVAALILIIVAGIVGYMLISKKNMFLGPLAGVANSYKNKVENNKAARDVAKAHKAEKAEQKRAEDQQKQAPKRESPPATSIPPKLGEKKILPDVKGIGNIANNLPRLGGKIQESEPAEKPSVAYASDVYKSPSSYSNAERVPYTPKSSSVPPQQPEKDGRIKVPKTTVQGKDPVSTIKDKERILKYIKEHPDGVSFIQMSNDLDIQPNNLTIMMKELVISDDVEKVKGLYYYKSHDMSPLDNTSSVVVWRLDGDK